MNGEIMNGLIQVGSAASTMPFDLFSFGSSVGNDPALMDADILSSVVHCGALRDLQRGRTGGSSFGSSSGSGSSGNGPGPKRGVTPRRHAISMNPRYHDGLVEFKRRCTDYASIMQLLDRIFGDNLHGVESFAGSQDLLRASDIDCGDGMIIEHLTCLFLRTPARRVDLDVVEPMDDYIAQTRARLAPLSSDQRLALQFIRSKSEEHFTGIGAAHYGIVFASHSLHLIPLPTLLPIAASIQPGGFLIVVIGARSSIMSILKDLFAPMPAITGADILQAMQGGVCGRQFDVCHVSQPSNLDLSDIELPENKGSLTEVPKNVLSLMIQKNIDEVDQTGYARVRQLVNERLHSDRHLQLDNDCFIFRMS